MLLFNFAKPDIHLVLYELMYRIGKFREFSIMMKIEFEKFDVETRKAFIITRIKPLENPTTHYMMVNTLYERMQCIL